MSTLDFNMDTDLPIDEGRTAPIEPGIQENCRLKTSVYGTGQYGGFIDFGYEQEGGAALRDRNFVPNSKIPEWVEEKNKAEFPTKQWNGFRSRMLHIMKEIGIPDDQIKFEASSQEDFAKKVSHRITEAIAAGVTGAIRLKVLLDKTELRYSELPKWNGFIENQTANPTSTLRVSKTEKNRMIRPEEAAISESDEPVDMPTEDNPFGDGETKSTSDVPWETN